MRTDPTARQTAGYVTVWDPMVRLLHWLIVACFCAAYFTQGQYYQYHLYSGYALLGLTAVRIVWGFVGSPNARFRTFVFKPSLVLDYLIRLMRLRPPRYLRLNPAGGAMSIALLCGIVLITLSGIALDGAENRAGPLGGTALFTMSGAIEEFHEAVTDITVVLALIHFGAVVFQSIFHRENLIASMVTGRKRRRTAT